MNPSLTPLSLQGNGQEVRTSHRKSLQSVKFMHWPETGKEKDRESGLDYYPARYRDADVPMWISPDAAREFDNLFAYMGNFRNSLNAVDLNGKDTKGVVKAAKDAVKDGAATVGGLAICSETFGIGCGLAAVYSLDLMVDVDNIFNELENKMPDGLVRTKTAFVKAYSVISFPEANALDKIITMDNLMNGTSNSSNNASTCGYPAQTKSFTQIKSDNTSVLVVKKEN